jgi:UDP-2,3-diacylglucosamine pyrophosphatase LpxH
MFKNGTNIFYISGNHDDPLRDRDLKENLKLKNNNYAGIMNVLSNFNHEEKHEFLSIKHGKIIVLHGDQYDAVTSNAKWISKFGGMLYDALIVFNRPLSKYLKNLTKKIVSSASGFQQLVKKECQEGGYIGLICGHNHRPEILKFKTHYYLNTGDWVESCSAIVEESDGTIRLIKIGDNLKITTLSEL